MGLAPVGSFKEPLMDVCPKFQKSQTTHAITTRRDDVDESGQLWLVEVVTLSCAVCRTLVRTTTSRAEQEPRL